MSIYTPRLGIADLQANEHEKSTNHGTFYERSPETCELFETQINCFFDLVCKMQLAVQFFRPPKSKVCVRARKRNLITTRTI